MVVYNRLSKNPRLQAVLSSIWRLVIGIQYKDPIPNLHINFPMMPIEIEVYEKFMKVLSVAFG